MTFSSLVPAQIPATVAVGLMPSPLGVVMLLGRWIWTDRQQLYYVQVQGHGDTEQQARNNAFRLAVEQAVGTLVLSETTVKGQQIVQDNITTYASGFVHRFVTVNSQHVAQQHQVTMDVWVAHSAIAQRLLADTQKHGNIGGQRLALQVESLQHERQAGDRLVETLLPDFPHRAFTVELQSRQVDLSHNRHLYIEVPVTVSWNTHYYRALNEAMTRTSQTRVDCFNFFKTLAGFPTDATCLSRQNRQFYFNQIAYDDANKISAVARHMTQNKPAMLIRLVNAQGTDIMQICQRFVFSNVEDPGTQRPTAYMLTVYPQAVHINPKYKLSGTIRLDLGKNPQVVQEATDIVVSMIAEQHCPDRR